MSKNGQKIAKAPATLSVHRSEIEELIAHVTAYHACDYAAGILDKARAEELTDRYRSAVEVPDGKGGTMRHVVFDQAEFFDSPAWWARLNRIHAEHSHDDENDLKPWRLHVAIRAEIAKATDREA